MRKACDRLYTQLEQLPVSPAGYGLVHYDFEPDNVFYDGETCHVIDFDDSMEHFYAIDLVQMIPYVVTIAVLIVVSLRKKRENQPPASLGNAYFREER